jgi:hypothetical protein
MCFSHRKGQSLRKKLHQRVEGLYLWLSRDGEVHRIFGMFENGGFTGSENDDRPFWGVPMGTLFEEKPKRDIGSEVA